MTVHGSLKIAVCQSAAGAGPPGRLQQIHAVLRRLGHGGTDLLVFPELYLSGYNVGSRIRDHAEPADGPFARAVSGLAAEYGIGVAYGYPEMGPDGLYNSVLCVDGDGRICANHRKTRLPPGFEKNLFQRGDRATSFDIAGWRVAVLICYEAEFPELVRDAARDGASLVIVPTALGDHWAFVAHQVMPTRAFENGVYLAYANHAGVEGDITYLGASCVVAPDGTDIARAGTHADILHGVIEHDRIQVIRDRLPYLRDLAREPHPKTRAARGDR